MPEPIRPKLNTKDTDDVATLRRYSNSYILVIRRVMLKALGWGPGDLIMLRRTKTTLVARKLDPNKVLPLGETKEEATT